MVLSFVLKLSFIFRFLGCNLGYNG